MNAPIQGMITTVATSLQGAVAAGPWDSAAGGVPVVNSGDLLRDGGQLLLPAGTVVAYTGVTETDDPDGFDVALFDADPGIAAEDFLQVYPAASETWADVETPAGDTIRAAVPHALKPLLLDGTRDPDAAEHVEVETVGTQFVVANVVAAVPVFTGQDVIDLQGNLAAEAATRAATLAQLAESVGAIPVVSYGTTAPESPKTGDVWFVTDARGDATSAQRWSGSEWVAQPWAGDALAAGSITAGQLAAGAVTADKIAAESIGADQLAANAVTAEKLSADAVTADAIAAGAIDGMTISGADIYSPNATAHPRAHLGGSKLEVIRADGDGAEYASLSLGGTDADQIMLTDSTGNALAGFDQNGNGLAQNLDVSGDFTVGGQDLFDDILDPYPLGVLAAQYMSLPTAVPAAGSGEIGTYELSFNARKGRAYRIVFDGNLTCSQANSVVALRIRESHGSTVENAPTPTTSSTQIGQALVQLGNASNGQRVHVEVPYNPYYTGPYGSRVLLTYQNTSGNYSTQMGGTSTSPSFFYVEDMGALPSGVMGDGQINSGGGTPYSGTAAAAPTAQRKTYTTTWQSSWSKSWQGGTVRTDVLGEGYYGGNQWYSMIGWGAANSTGGEAGKTLAAALSGATVTKVEVMLVDKSWYAGSGGKAKIGRHSAASAPSNPQTSGGSAFDSPQWTRGATKWVTLPTGWYSDFAAGKITGITLGEGAGTNQTYYGKFSTAAKDCQLRVTYTK